MRRCDKCGCLCDPGDLVNGICDDCREEEQKKGRWCRTVPAVDVWQSKTNGVARF